MIYAYEGTEWGKCKNMKSNLKILYCLYTAVSVENEAENEEAIVNFLKSLSGGVIKRAF